MVKFRYFNVVIYFIIQFIFAIVRGQNLSFCVGLKAPFTNNNAFEEEKALEKAP